MTTLLLPSLSLLSRAFSQRRQSNPKTPTEFLQLIKRSTKHLPIRSDRSVSIPVMLLRSIESCIQRILSHHCTNTRNPITPPPLLAAPVPHSPQSTTDQHQHQHLPDPHLMGSDHPPHIERTASLRFAVAPENPFERHGELDV